MVKDIRIEDFDYPLPEERIALHPLEKRDGCRLLFVRPDGRTSHRKFHELGGLLPLDTLLVCNDTKVINARLEFHKDSGARIEIFLMDPKNPTDYNLMFQTRGKCEWYCLVGNSRKWKEGALQMCFKDKNTGQEITLRARRVESDNTENVAIEFTWTPEDLAFATVIESAGEIPIPPYLNRESQERDLSDYQTVYARAEGSVAAPTAGLHFTPALFDDIRAHNIEIEKLTLHVGAGTFKPVKSETIGEHPMHTEAFSVKREMIDRIIFQKKNGYPVIAVGTTSVRTLESLPLLGFNIMNGRRDLYVSQWEAYSNPDEIDPVEALEHLKGYMENEGLEELTASTSIMIAPGFRWRIADGMVTNFHQPKSTLLLLVSSFLERKGDGEMWRKIYDEALDNGYRFLSYGDACFFL